MPFYNYICNNKNCLHKEIDIKRRITDTVSSYICPKCGTEMKQLYSLFRFELKGKGWYETDYKNKTIKKEDS